MQFLKLQVSKILLNSFILINGLTIYSIAQIPGESGRTGKNNILVIHSYHKGFTWTEHIQLGIDSVLNQPDVKNQVEVFTEYLDSKRYSDSAHFTNFKNYMKLKYRSRNLKMVITSDDDAFRFSIKFRDELLHNVPILFCGVNNLADYQKGILADETNYTGLIEGFDLQNTIELAVTLHPEAQNMFIINDETPTGLANYNAFVQLKKNLPQKIAYQFIEPFDMDSLQGIMQKLPTRSVILLLTYNQDKDGDYYSYQEAGTLISQATPLPIYVVWDFYLGTGVVGGKVISGIDQGKRVASLALQLLKGESADNIPILWESTNVCKFDFQQLKKHEIQIKNLPNSAILINKPESVFKKYQKEFCISAIYHNPVILATTSLSKILSPKYLLFSL